MPISHIRIPYYIYTNNAVCEFVYILLNGSVHKFTYTYYLLTYLKLQQRLRLISLGLHINDQFNMTHRDNHRRPE